MTDIIEYNTPVTQDDFDQFLKDWHPGELIPEKYRLYYLRQCESSLNAAIAEFDKEWHHNSN